MEKSNSVISPEDIAALETIAFQLENPDLPTARRAELLAAGTSIAERYACDVRDCD